MGRVLAILASGCILTGCSSSLPSLNLDFLKSSPATESMRIESDPPGAEAKVASGTSCRTPCELTVQPGSDTSITLTLAGYQPHTVSLRSDGGESGNKLTPNPVYAELQKAAPVPAKKKVAAKKKPTTTAAVVPQNATAAVQTPPPAAAPAAEPPPSGGSSYPWSTGR